MSKANDIALAFAARLGQITIANGYSTDIGLRIFRGRPSLDKEDLPCIVIVEGDDNVLDTNGTKVKLAQQYVFEGHDQCDPEHPNDKAHLIMADIKRAVFAGDLTYDGLFKREWVKYLGRAIGTREDGTSIVAASITIEAQYAEDLASP